MAHELVPKTVTPDEETDAGRRTLMQQAACVAGAWAASGLLPAVAGDVRQSHPRSLLVDPFGKPISARALKPGETLLFNYPFAASPVFLIATDDEVRDVELLTEAKQRYAAPAGVGPKRNLVAFSAICAHKLMYPTPALSFIGVRRGTGSEPAQVIHCCGDNSRYDPARGAAVMSGPAPQPLAAVLLEWDAQRDQLHAVGTRGGEKFAEFFEKYAFKLEMELGRRAREAAAGATTIVKPASAYSRQWQSCPA
ncbi:(2Fe-2S)-binding protein [Piscinibacter aquaticus]|uniref:(2Fe-2S)-binding protein n=1 Tax=Piscinibacter aquaticus TaxID=392597 RepID=A0A5C6U185_9BURK|nr:(2Fe-2S)-binding protein [Piscinibacter aquaticus]